MCYLQQPASQHAGSPQQFLTAAADAERDKSRTAAIANGRTLIFIKFSFMFSTRNGLLILRKDQNKLRDETKLRLNSQVVLELKNWRVMAQTCGQFSQRSGDDGVRPRVIRLPRIWSGTRSIR
jgi:hypothetical protein